MLRVKGVHYGGRHTLTLWSRGACRQGLAWCGGAGRSGSGGVGIGEREVVCALLEVVDPVLDVLGVRVHGRRDDLGEVVGEEIGRVEARVARPIPPALPVFGTTGKEAEATGTAAPNATERLYYQRHYLVTLHMPRVVVVALVERHVPLACAMVKGAVCGQAALVAA